MQPHDLYKAMSDALGTAGTNRLQSTVREYIEEYSHCDQISRANDIAYVISDFKTKQMHEAGSGYTDELDYNAFVKKMDNIINDTARICRHELGYTIVCKKRGNVTKGKDWVYAPEIPKAPKIKVPAPVAIPPCTQIHYDPAVHMHKPVAFWDGVLELCKMFAYDYGEIYHIIGKTPENVLAVANGMGITPLQMGKAVAHWIRESEKVVTKENDND